MALVKCVPEMFFGAQVCEANAAEGDIEEVLDTHIEELIKECKEEIKLIPLMNGELQPFPFHS